MPRGCVPCSRSGSARPRPGREGGAGMGLIEIARRCAEPMQYSFRPVDGSHSFFCLTVVV